MMKKILFIAVIILPLCIFAQDVERKLPAEWSNLVEGSRFIDRFLPMPIIGELTSDTWGCSDVTPRDTLNGIEDPLWSYWGGKPFKDENGKYNMFVCRWREDHPKGHWAYHYSEIVRAISDNPVGPYKATDQIVGLGHNPELYKTKDGKYVIYVVGEGHYMYYYIADKLEGPWKKGDYTFDLRDRKKLRFMVNMSFVEREDGSVITLPRAGDMWISETGISPYYRISNKSQYPPIPGKYEDPVIWKTDIQYHMIVNDWYGRIAHYQRSKDGIHWKHEPGEAYYPGVSKYEDGTVTTWYKYERPRMLQDEYGRATQINFAVIDSSKHADFPNDHHNSKNISIPLTKGRLMEVLNRKKIDNKTKTIQLRIKAESDFNPHKEIDLKSLRLGASEEVNFGRGCKVLKSKKDGKDIVITFDGSGNGLTDDNWVLKLLGKTKNGKQLYGYARIPEIDYLEPILSSRKPHFEDNDLSKLVFEVQNFGMSKSVVEDVIVEITTKEEKVVMEGQIPALEPYAKAMVELSNKEGLKESSKGHVLVYVKGKKDKPIYDQTMDLSHDPEASIIIQKKGTIQDQLKVGGIVSKDCKGKPGINYHVYLPENYDPKNPPAIVIAFSPGGKGRGILDKMLEGVKASKWILVGCDSLRNNMKNQALEEEIEDALINDIFKTVPHNKNRVYLAGFSGGAMRAYGITARRPEKFAGVIAYGGWLGGNDYQDKLYCEGMSVAIINGDKDKGANKWDEIDTATLKKNKCTVKKFTHPGGHKISNAETTQKAIEWLETQWNKKR